MTIRVLIADDQEILRRGLRMLLETVDGIEVIAEAADGAEALALIPSGAPDVLLTDARMPGMNGLELLTRVRRDHPELPVLVLTTFDDVNLVRAVLDGGAAGFLLKDVSTVALADAIAQVVDGGLVIDPRVARAALRREPAPADPLTPSERAVADLVAQGRSNAEIAAQLVLAEGTVKNTVSALLRKLGERDRTALALRLVRDARDWPPVGD